MSERIKDVERMATLERLCRVAIGMAEQRRDYGKIPFLSDVQTFAKAGTATVLQEAAVLRNLEKLRSSVRTDPSGNGYRKGSATAHAKRAPAKLTNLSFLSKGEDA